MATNHYRSPGIPSGFGGSHFASRAQFEENLAVKRNDSRFTSDIEPLLSPGTEWDLDIAMDAVLPMTAVKDLQQTVVDEIKAANADGKITDAEKLKIKNTALANVKSYLGTKGIRVLSGVFGLSGGALDGFLSSKIESAVHDLRVTNRAVTNK
jgi:hypothetical protein